MPVHPMFDAVLVSTHPDGDRVFKITIAYPQGTKRFDDWTYSSREEALADIPRLQAEGKLPTDSELFA